MQKLVTNLQIESANLHKDVESLQARFDLLSRSLGEIQDQVTKMASESDRSTETLNVNQVLVEQRKLELEQSIARTQALTQQVAVARDGFEKAACRSPQTRSGLERNSSKLIASCKRVTRTKRPCAWSKCRMKEHDI